MSTAFYLSLFIFGTIIGSFLNVVILRFNTGKNITGRSGCFSCGNTLSWYELIPIVSYCAQKGRCRNCKSAVSLQYPIVEAVTGLVFYSLAYVHGLSAELSSLSLMLFSVDAIIWAILIVITVYDLKHMIIPDALSGSFFAVAIVRLCILAQFGNAGLSTIISHSAAALSLAGFFFILWLVSDGRWIGLGDSKLALGMGLYLGFAQGLSAFAYAFWIGAIVGVTKIALQKMTEGKENAKKGTMITMKSEIPFAPFLVLGTYIALILRSDVFHLELFF